MEFLGHPYAQPALDRPGDSRLEHASGLREALVELALIDEAVRREMERDLRTQIRQSVNREGLALIVSAPFLSA